MRYYLTLSAHAAILLSKGLLRTVGYKRASRLLTALSPTPRHPDPARAVRLVRAVHQASGRRFFGTTCLERSLAAWWLLRWRGCPAQLRVGVRHTEGGFEAHAWLAQGGRVLNDDPAQVATYTPFSQNMSPDQVRGLF
jgi:hypothetical protein